MDAVLTALAGSLPQASVGGVLVLVIGFLVKLLMDEKGRHDATRAGLQTDLDKQAERLARQHERDREQDTADEQELRAELAAVRARCDELQLTVDIEREARRAAEDAAARAARGRSA